MQRASNGYYNDLLKAARELEESSKRVEFSQWHFGDKLLELIPIGKDGERNNSFQELKDASDYLRAQGHSYSPSTLLKYRQISHLYPPETRGSGVSYTVHRTVGDPRLLAAIVAIPRPEGQDLTDDFARKMVSEIEAANLATWHREREEAHEEAARVIADAKNQEREATEEAQNAKDEKARQRAESRQAEAHNRAKEAREVQKRNKNIQPPKEYIKAPPATTMLTGIVLSSTLKALALDGSRLASEMKKQLEESGDQLHADSKAAIMEICLQAHQGWLDAANSLRPSKPNGSHLSVIENPTGTLNRS